MPANHLFFLVEQQRRMLGIKNVELNDGKQDINYIKPSPTQNNYSIQPQIIKIIKFVNRIIQCKGQ